MHVIIFLAFIFVAAYMFAKIEVVIEGPKGWAEGFDTWRLPHGHWVNKLFFGNKPATGYHVWMNLFMLYFIHMVYLFQPVSLSTELRLIAFLTLFWITEDFLWFLINPAYGWKKFKKEHIWWHAPNWWVIAPRDYFIALPVAALLYYLAGKF